MVTDMSDFPAANIGLLEPFSCIDSVAMLDIGTSDTGDTISYVWNGPSISNVNTLVIEPTEPGQYILKVTNDLTGCEALDTIQLVLPDEPDGLDVDIDLPVCFGDSSGSVLVTNVTGGTPAYLYSLNGDDLTADPLFENLLAGTYMIEVVDGNGCTYGETFVVPDGQLLTIDIGPDIDLDLGDSVILWADVSFPWSQVDSLVWAAGDHLSCTHCFTPTLYAIEDEVISATVYSGGCMASDSLRLRVDVDADVYIPNVFSPNDDGINDHVTVFADPRVRKVVFLEIFDRWGNQVFVGHDFLPNDPVLGWDGTFKNKPMNPAVFAYVAKVELINGQQVSFKGDITLLR
jgi:gliding motility-associated-like protein